MESIREVDFSGLKVPFVAVYGHPDDFPDKYVARIYELDKATDTIMVKETLEEITADIKEHTAMTFIPRGTADVPSHTRSRGAILSRRQFHSSCQVHTGSQ